MSDESDIQTQQDNISNSFHLLVKAAQSIIDANKSLKLEIEKEKAKLDLNEIQNMGNK